MGILYTTTISRTHYTICTTINEVISARRWSAVPTTRTCQMIRTMTV
jgi:RNA polymerase-binding transcription factor DksA